MVWCEVRGHDAVIEKLRRAVVRGRLASTYLFVGPSGIGKRTLAIRLAQALLCQVNPEERLLPCRTCDACQQVAAGSHPDLEVISKPADKAFIPLELLIGDREHRMQEGLCHRISLKPFFGGRRIAIIDDADYLNQEGANCLLKTLEEPPPHSLILLVGTNEQRQLPTVRSRSQVVRFAPLSREDVVDLLLSVGIVSSQAEAVRLADLSGGSVERAGEFADEEWCAFRSGLLQLLPQLNAEVQNLAQNVITFVDQAGKDTAARRLRLRRVVRQTLEVYRLLTRELAGARWNGDATLSDTVRRLALAWTADQEAAAGCVDRCLDAEVQIESNASPATIIDCWLDDLVRGGRGE